MSRRPIQIRLAPDQIDKLAAIAAKMQVSKTSIIEDGIDIKIAQLEKYLLMDKGPPKKTKISGISVHKEPGLPADVLVVVGPPDVHGKCQRVIVKNVETRSIRGYDAITKEPIYR